MIVYLITNLVNGKLYVGQTQQSLKARWLRHRREHRTYLSRAIKKYGRENFLVEPLATAETLEQLDALEGLWIRLLASHVRGVGYNVRLAAKGYRTLPPESIEQFRRERLGHEVTRETRDKIAKSLAEHHRVFGHPNKGKSMPETQIAKLRELKGSRNARFGKHDTPEVCEKRRQAIIGKRYRQSVRRSDGGRNNAAGKRSEGTKLRMRWLRLVKRVSGPVLMLQHGTGNYF